MRLYPIGRWNSSASERGSSPEAAVSKPLLLWIATLGLLAIGLALAFSISGWRLGNIFTIAVLVTVAAVAERGRVRLTRGTESSISLVPTLFGAVLFGPLASMLIAAGSMLGCSGPRAKRVAYACSRAVAGAAAGLSAFEALAASPHRFWDYALATTVGVAVIQMFDTLFFVVFGKLRGYQPRQLLGAVGPTIVVSVPLYAPLIAALAFAYADLSPWTLPLFVAPALAAQRLFGLYQNERLLAENLSTVNQRLERANISFATALVATLDARDRYTAGHSAAVAIYARDIARRLGLSEEEQRLAHVCGLVHDIGKIGLPVGLLEKPGPLTLDERRQMEKHSEIGERILAKVDDYAEIARIVRHHHERWDGQGYPDGLRVEAIPLISRIIGVADAYNAMTSDRPYRDAMPSQIARLRLAQGVGSQFDTSIVAAFEAILAGATESYRMATRGDFSLVERDDLRATELAEVA